MNSAGRFQKAHQPSRQEASRQQPRRQRLRRRVGILGQGRRRRRFLTRTPHFESLEERRLLVVQLAPLEPLPAGDRPIGVRLAPVNAADPDLDLLTLGADGQLTVAVRGPGNTWDRVQTTDLALGALFGLETLSLQASDLTTDLAVQGADAITILAGDGQGAFQLRQTFRAAAGSLAPPTDGHVGMAAGLLDDDLQTDLVSVAPGANQVLVMLNAGDGSLTPPRRYSSGADNPVVVVSGNWVGAEFPDLAVGHQSGVVSFLEGTGDGTFRLRPGLSVRELGSIQDLAVGDYDSDGDHDLAVSATDRVTLLLNDDDRLATKPIVNGTFAAGMTGWTSEVLGHPATVPDAGPTTRPPQPGTVQTLGEFAQLTENDSFLVSLQQTFLIPPAPQTISVDIVSLGLTLPEPGELPDVFEISLLDSNARSLVPVHQPGATSFLNINPGNAIRTAHGVTFDGTTVTLDISQLAPGTPARLVFDLVGQPSGTSSVAAIDNVRIRPERLATNTMTRVDLDVTVTAASGLEQADLDGDGDADLVLAEGGLLRVYEGDGRGGFTRATVDLSRFGASARAVAAAPLLTGDRLPEVVVTMLDTDQVLTSLPLGGSGWLPRLDFQTDAWGNPLAPGDLVAEQWAPWGIHITTQDPDRHPAMLFDTAHPTGNDWDLGTPNSDFGGPGTGAGGERGRPGANRRPLDQVLIVSEDANPRDPDDNAAGGSLIFSFDQPVMLDDVHLLDIEEAGGTIELFDERGARILSQPIRGLGDNSFQVVRLDAVGVSRLVIHLAGSGAVAEVVFCRKERPGRTVRIDGDPAVDEGTPYTLTLDSGSTAVREWTINWGDGSIETFADIESATHIFADGASVCTIVVTARSGLHRYVSNRLQVEVRNVPAAVTIAGQSQVAAQATYTLDLSALDPGEDTITHWVIDWGDGREVIAGNPSSVSHVYDAGPATHTVRAYVFDEDNSRARFEEQDGLVAIEAESYSEEKPGQGVAEATQWVRRQHASAAAAEFVQALPNSGVNTYDELYGARLDYDILFETPGIYYVWVRMLGDPEGQNDSLHAGLNGQAATLGNVGLTNNRGKWQWEGEVVGRGSDRVTIEVASAGWHTFHLWMREDGTKVDKFLLTTDEAYQPQGLGPDEWASLVSAYLSNPLTVTVEPPVTRFFVVDSGADAAFRYDDLGTSVGDFALKNRQPRDVTTVGEGNPLWVIDANRRVYVFDTSGEKLLGSWKAEGLHQPEGIATDGTDLWIVDDHHDRVFRYAGAATRRAGAQAAAESFPLVKANHQPTGITTDGQTLWVVDASADRVFVYDLSGGLQTNWKLDAHNRHPSGITIDPSGREGIWVVDRGSAYVYAYSQTTPASTGRQKAASRFRLADGNRHPEGIADPGGHFQIGQVVEATIQDSAIPDDWTFDAVAGQRIFLDTQPDQFFRFDWSLTSPSGSVLFSDGFRDQDVTVLPESGTYTLRVQAVGTHTGSYQFQLVEVPDTITTAIERDTPIDGEIVIPGETDRYTFSAAADDYVFFDTLAGSPLQFRWTLTGPSGQILFDQRWEDQGAIRLPETGEYALLVDLAGDRTDPYRFEVVSVATPVPQPIALRQVIAETITRRGEFDLYSFSATAGEQLFFDVHSGDQNKIDWNVSGPDGTVLFSRPLTDQGTFTLASSGQYTLTVDGRRDGTGPYQIQVWNILDPGPRPLPFNELVLDARAQGQTIRYEFTGAVGQELALDIRLNESNLLAFTLLDPDGNAVFESVRGDQVLPRLTQAGVYTLQVAPSGADRFAKFEIGLWELAAPRRGQLDNLGTDFWLAFPRGIHDQGNKPQLSLFLTAATETTAILSSAGLGLVERVLIPAGEVLSVPLPESAELGAGTDLLEDKGIRITASQEIAVYGLSRERFSTDAYLGLPVAALGREYLVLGYENTGNENATQLALVATADNTTVTVTPAATTGSREAGTPYTIVLNQGQTYQLTNTAAGADLTGTALRADQPIAVFGGHRCTNVPAGVAACDYLVEQLPPLETWGRRFVTLPLATRQGGDTFRFLARDPGTEVRVNGTLVATLDRGQFHEQLVEGPAEIVATGPLLVAQYSNGTNFDRVTGDPFMMLIPPFEQFAASYTVTTLAEGFDAHYINLVVASDGAGQIAIDGTAVPANQFTPIGTSGFSGAQVRVAAGTHRLTGTRPFGAFMYGFGPADSYGYPGGTSLGPVAGVARVELSPATATVGVGAEHALTAQIAAADGRPLEGVRVDFQITGPNAASGFAFSDAAGEARFSYPGSQAGTDSITAFVGILFDTARVTWSASHARLVLTSPAGGSEFPTGSVQLVSGHVVQGDPPVPITHVTVSGRPVDALDAAGNFFTLVTIAAGSQTLDFTAHSAASPLSSESLLLVGTDHPPEEFSFQNLQDLTTHAQVEFRGATYNRQLQVLNATARVRNTGPDRLAGPLYVLFDPFVPAAVDLVDPDGTLARPHRTEVPFVAFTDQISPDGLGTGQASAAARVSFANPLTERFRFALELLAPANQSPAFSSVPVSLAVVGEPHVYAATATDPEGHRLVWTVDAAPPGLAIDSATGRVAWTPGTDDLGAHEVWLTARDPLGGRASQRYTLQVVEPAPTNRAPLFVSQPPLVANLAGQASVTYAYNLLALDADHDRLTYRLVQGPPGMSLDRATGALRWRAGAAEIGSHSVTVRVLDGQGGSDTQLFTLDIVDVQPGTIRGQVFEDQDQDGIKDPAEPLLGGWTIYIDSNANGRRDRGERFSVSNAAGNYVLNNLLPGTHTVAQEPQTGWQQSAPVSGTHRITLAAGQSVIGRRFGNFFLGGSVSPPEFRSSPPLLAQVNQVYRYTAAASDPDGDALTFALLAAPRGMSLDSASGSIVWQPSADQQANQEVLLQVGDGQGGLALQAFTVAVAPEFQPPVITSRPVLVATVDQRYRYAVAALDPDNGSLTYSLGAPVPSGMTIHRTSGLVTWTPGRSATGRHTVQIVVSDGNQEALQTYPLEVRPANTPPRFTTSPDLEAAAGSVYRYDSQAIDAEDSVVYSLARGPAGMSVQPLTGIVRWPTSGDDLGSHPVVIRATDDRGLVRNQSFTIRVTPDATPPNVALLLSGNVFEPNQSLAAELLAEDHLGVVSLALEIGGQNVTLTGNTGSWTFTQPGIFDAVATATDAAGNVGIARRRIRVLDPQDQTPPTVTLEQPRHGDVITYLADVLGSVSDPNLESYRVEAAPVGTDQWTIFAEVHCVESPAACPAAAGSQLGIFDPTLLANDNYELRVVAQDVSGNIRIEPLEISVEAQAKLGDFRLEFTDLEIPLAGIPIQIRRIYHTLEAGYVGDFGYGWSLSLSHARIRETVRVSPAEASGVAALLGANRFRLGTRVYLSAPDGRRVAFTFDPVPEPSLLGALWRPRFTPDPGVYDQLAVEDLPLQQLEDGTFGLYLTGFPYNPREYTLTTKDQQVLHYDQFADLRSITDRNGVRLTYTNSGITSSLGPAIRWERDAQGRIQRILDPAGNAIQYAYDPAGNLISVTDQARHVTRMSYHADRAHHLEELHGPRGNLVSRTEYDDSGRAVAVVDADGQRIETSYDLTAQQEIVADRLGNETVLLFDDRGNVVQVTDSRGATTRVTYDADDNETSLTDANGHRTSFGYDAAGNLTLAVQPDGSRTVTRFNDRNDVTSVTYANGTSIRQRYDDRGNRIEFTDAAGQITRSERDAQGRVRRLVDPRGVETLFEYDDFAEPSRIRVDGTEQQFTRDIFGSVTSFTDELGNRLEFTYDAAGRLVGSTDFLGNSRQTIYDGEVLRKTIDPLGRETTFTFDARGDLVQIVDPLGGVSRYEYDANRNRTRYTDPLGRQTVWTYQHNLLVSATAADGGQTTYTYDANGNRLSVTDPLGRVTHSAYDERDRLVSFTDARGAVQSFGYDSVDNLVSWTDANGGLTSYAYDPLGRPLRSTDPLLRTVSWTYDGNGNLLSYTNARGAVSSYEYDARNQRTRAIDALGNQVLLGYDEAGNLTSITDQLGLVTRWEYDANRRLVRQVDARGGVAQYEYDAAGNNTRFVDELGRSTRLEYDALDRIVRITDPLSGQVSTRYDAVGNVLAFTDPNGNRTTNRFDSVNRLVASTDPLGHVVRYRYDLAGNLIEYQDQLGERTTYAYDALDQLVRRVDPLGGETQFEYDAVGNRIRQIDELGLVTRYEFDPANQLVATIDPRGGRTELAYDANGNLSRLVDPLGNVTQYEYDLLDHVVRQVDALGQSSRFGYDAVGNRISSTDRNGRTRTFRYDALQQLVQEVWLDSAGNPVETRAYTYDAVGNQTSAADSHSRYSLTYDRLDRLKTIDNRGTPRGMPRVLLTYTYDAGDNLLSLADQAGATQTLTHDGRDQVRSIVWSGAELEGVRAEFDYDPRGDRIAVRRFDQTVGGTPLSRSTLAYDAQGRLSELVHRDAADAVLAEYDYLYDLADRLVEQTISSPARSAAVSRYAYDDSSQLTRADHNAQPDEAYAYDANGNRSGTDYRVGPGNRLLADAQYEYVYDNEGNLIRRTEIATGGYLEFVYDHRNRLASVSRRSSTGVLIAATSFTYDVFDRRLATTVDADGAGPGVSETVFTSYAGPHAWADYGGGGQLLARYLYGARVDELLARWRSSDATGGNPATAWYLTDALGSVRDIVGASGAAIYHTDYTSFGGLVGEVNAAAGDRFKFTGREWDAQTGLYYYRARYYSPESGRFLSEDPLSFISDENPYRYVGNSPLTATDPSGLVAVASYAGATKYSRVFTALASGLAGYTLGYTCGQLTAHTVLGLWGAEAEEYAQRQGLLAFSIDVGVGLTLGATRGRAAVIAGSVFFAAGALLSYLQLREATGPALIVESVCLTVSVGAGTGVTRVLSPFDLPNPRFRSSASRKLDVIYTSGKFSDDTLRAVDPPTTQPEPPARKRTAVDAADDAIAVGKTRGAAAQLDINGQRFTDVSGAKPDLHPRVQEALDSVPPAERPPWHGRCAEVGCVDQALKAGIDDLEDATSIAVNIGKSGMGHGTFKEACSSCRRFLQFFGIKS